MKFQTCSAAAIALTVSAAMIAPATAQLAPGELVAGSRRFGSIYGPMPASISTPSLISGADLSLAASPVRGSGGPLTSPNLTLCFVPPARLVASPGVGLFEVDAATGNRTLLAGTTNATVWTGNGDMIPADAGSLFALVDDFNRGQLGDGKLLLYDLESAVTTVVSATAHGDGPVMHRPRSLTRIDANTVAVVEFGLNGAPLTGCVVYLVDLTTGNRTVLSTMFAGNTTRYTATGGVRSTSTSVIPPRGTGPVFTLPCRAITYLNGHLIVAGSATSSPSFLGGFIEIDLATGNRTLLAGTAIQSGIPVTIPFGAGSDPYVCDSPNAFATTGPSSFAFTEVFGPDQVWEFDVNSRTVRVISNLDRATLPQFRSAQLSGLAIVPCGATGAGFTITTQPAPVDGCEQWNAAFTVAVSTVGPVHYQWRKNAMPIDAAVNPSAATSSLELLSLAQSDAGSYTCAMTNACGTITSNPAALTILTDCCDPIDFNQDGLYPDTTDVADFLSVFSGGVCDQQLPTDPPCNTDIDYNNDTLFPDTGDISSLLSVFSGGPCI